MSHEKSPLLEARNITKTYETEAGPLHVLRGLDLALIRGEILAVMGSSGVGKSTFLHILGLLDHPSQGELLLHVNDKSLDLSSLNRAERARLRNLHIGFVFQSYHLLPDLNVLENVLLPAMIRYGKREFHRRKDELTDRARSLLRKVQLDRDTHRPTMLSGGERQRATIARGLMNEPQLLLCDEPTGNLDQSTSDEIHQLFVSLNEELGTTFLIVTHDPNLAEKFCHRTVTMVDGNFAD